MVVTKQKGWVMKWGQRGDCVKRKEEEGGGGGGEEKKRRKKKREVARRWRKSGAKVALCCG